MGSEENGCRGAEAFAKKHKKEFDEIDSTIVNMDTLTLTHHQFIFNKEGVFEFPPEISNLLAECCKELGYKYSVGPMPPIAGGTDSRGFVKYGLNSSSICGLNFKDYLHYYHTERDNIEIVNKKRRPLEDNGTCWKDRNIRGAMEIALNICLKYLEKKDNE